MPRVPRSLLPSGPGPDIRHRQHSVRYLPLLQAHNGCLQQPRQLPRFHGFPARFCPQVPAPTSVTNTA
ncbi:Hypp9304 [Branchiostoma lanceolatum]|uniref:Hypp9304 protein n=1 Tax=Branchiostoma lanceolatum TaxID=7740 RepID=A0A8K0EIA9_BRALA|nr:Hypp9304 [Branchiostoma lanceolatum]